MRSLYLLFVIALVLSAPARAGSVSPVSTYVQRAMLHEHIPGMAVAIVDRGRVVVEKAYGVANIEWNRPVTLHSPFQLASTTKVITATTLMRLVQDGRLQLNDSIGTYLPDVPAALKAVTIRELAAHLSGLPMTPLNAPAHTFADALRLAEGLPLQWAPGSRTGYVSDDYIVLRAVMERASGMPYETLAERTVLQPLGMADTAFDDTADDGVIQISTPIAGRVDNYKWNGTRELLFHGTYRWATAAGAFSSIDDLTKWAVGLDRHTVLGEASIATMGTAVARNDGRPGPFGIGVVVAQRNGEATFGHSGGPALAEIVHFVGRDVTVIVLQNQIAAMPHFAGDIADAYLHGRL